MIDCSRLDELRGEIGSEGLAEVAMLFLDEADELVAHLGQPSSPGDLAARLHFLKGSALNLGLVDLADRCQDGERRLADGTFAEGDIPGLIAAYGAARAAFLGVMGGDMPGS